MTEPVPRRPEPEYMDDAEEAAAYAGADFDDVNAAFVERLAELAGAVQDAEALDLGTGPGDIPVRVARACPSWHITALDASAAMLAFARQAVTEAGLEGRITCSRADAKKTGLPNDAFDVIFSNSILHHITDVDPLWSEVVRVGRSGALIFLRDLVRPADQAEAGRIVETYAAGESELLQEEFYRSLLSAYTVEEVRGQLDRAGLQSLTVEMVTDRHMDIHGWLG